MCVVSMIYDHYDDRWRRHLDDLAKQPVYVPIQIQPAISQEEIAEFRRLLERAREYDKRTGQPDCEMEDKREKLRKLAEELGVKIDFV
jgi:hypothetical protein